MAADAHGLRSIWDSPPKWQARLDFSERSRNLTGGQNIDTHDMIGLFENKKMARSFTNLSSDILGQVSAQAGCDNET